MYGLQDQLISAICALAEKQRISKVLLFGSRARGDSTVELTGGMNERNNVKGGSSC